MHKAYAFWKWGSSSQGWKFGIKYTLRRLERRHRARTTTKGIHKTEQAGPRPCCSRTGCPEWKEGGRERKSWREREKVEEAARKERRKGKSRNALAIT